MVKPNFKVGNKTRLISCGAERDCGEGRVYDAHCWHPYGDQKDSYLLPPLNGSTPYQHDNLETWGNTQYFTYGMYGIGGLIRNKIKGLIIDLSLFGLVWSLARGSDWATQAILQFSIAQAALNFVEILFLQSPIPVSKHPLFLIVFQSPGFFNIFLTVL